MGCISFDEMKCCFKLLWIGFQQEAKASAFAGLLT